MKRPYATIDHTGRLSIAAIIDARSTLRIAAAEACLTPAEKARLRDLISETTALLNKGFYNEAEER